jgi:hypothetical protein
MGLVASQSAADPFDQDQTGPLCGVFVVEGMGQGSSSSGSPPKGKKVLLQKLSHADKTGVLNLADQDLKPNSSIWLKISQDGMLPKLKSLDISGNGIKSFPAEINMMSNLKSLTVARCSLQRTIDISVLIKLTQLNLDNNDLEAAVFAPVPHLLQRVSVANNHFTVIPPALGPLVHVVELNLSGNRIENTSGLGLLTALVDLNLDDNAIAELTLDMCLLTNLRHLSLKGNLLSKHAVASERVSEQSIPEGVFTDTALDSIDLSRNDGLTKAIVMDFKGIDVFLERRKKTKDKAFAGGAMHDTSLFGDLM